MNSGFFYKITINTDLWAKSLDMYCKFDEEPRQWQFYWTAMQEGIAVVFAVLIHAILYVWNQSRKCAPHFVMEKKFITKIMIWKLINW